MFRKLRNKFLGLNMATTTILVLIIFGVVYFNTHRTITTENRALLNNVASSFVYHDNQKLSKVTSEYVPSFLMKVNSNGNVLGIDSFIDMPQSLYIKIASTAWSRGGSSTIYIDNKAWLYKIEEVDNTYQITFLDITTSRRYLSNLLATFLFLGAIILIIIFLISRYFANRAISPILEAWEKQKRFVADASHELKTPITTIMANCDVLVANEEETIKSQKEWLEYIRIGAERMNKLIISLLSFARVDGASGSIAKTSFSLSNIIEEVENEQIRLINSRALTIKKNIEIKTDVFSYKEAVRQVIAILYENAIKYTNYAGEIEIVCQQQKRNILFTIRNTGEGIRPADLPHVFDRFFRADNARTQDDNSYGLGLAIAKSLAEQIYGNISVKSEQGLTEFTFVFRI
jgi:signal transduction histidine kinase